MQADAEYRVLAALTSHGFMSVNRHFKRYPEQVFISRLYALAFNDLHQGTVFLRISFRSLLFHLNYIFTFLQLVSLQSIAFETNLLELQAVA